MKKTLSILSAAALALSVSVLGFSGCAPQPPEEQPAEGQAVIFHTNDTHGYLQESEEDGIIGIARVAALKEQTEGALLVDAGDATQGLPVASLTQGADVIELFNLAGYDAMALGNHEFDFGTENLLQNVRRADFPMLAANVYDGDEPLLAGVQEGSDGCSVILESGGLQVGIFALTTADTRTSTNPVLVGDLDFRSEIETAKEQIDALEAAGADAVVALCHMGNSDATCTSVDLAEAMTGEYEGRLDAIIDGHSHTTENGEVNGVLIAQTGTGLTQVGKMTLTAEDGEVTVEEELLSYEDVASVQPSAAVAEKLAEIEASQEDLLGEKVGDIDFTLWAGQIGEIAMTRAVETNFGDFAADAVRSAAEQFAAEAGIDAPVVAAENGGGIRAAIPYGEVTVGSLVSAFPFSNTIFIKQVTPKILYEVMEVSGSLLDGQDENGMLLQTAISGGFLQVSGFTVRFDPDAGEGEHKVVSITLDGESQPLDRDDDTRAILMASNNFIMSGGNDYTMLASLPKLGEPGGELEVMRAYFEDCLASGSFANYARPQGRIRMDGGSYAPKDYTATLLVERDGQPLADAEVSYILDGGAAVAARTDGQGYLRITVADGAHSVRLAGGTREVYIDNYLGIGLVEDALRTYPVLR